MGYTDSGDEYDKGFVDRFGKAASFMPPKVEFIERHPDKRRSSNDVHWTDDKAGIRLVMAVRGEGALVMRASSGHPDGRLQFEGLAIFTNDEIQFDK